MILEPVSHSFIRPNDVNPYAIGDSISDSTSAPTIGSLNPLPRGLITGYQIEVLARTNNPAWTAALRMHLYAVAPPAVADNAPLTLLWADRAKRLGVIDLPQFSTAGTGSDMAQSYWRDIPKRLHLTTRDSDGLGILYYRLEAREAGTPTAQQVFEFIITCRRGD